MSRVLSGMWGLSPFLLQLLVQPCTKRVMGSTGQVSPSLLVAKLCNNCVNSSTSMGLVIVAQGH